MRQAWWVALLFLFGCGDDTAGMADAAGQDARVDAPLIDAPSVDAPRIDASIDAPMSDAEADAAATCLGTAESCGQNPTACVNCAGNAAGHTCIGNTMCGCNVETDCPTFVACDTSTHACTNACSATQPCNGGCCSMSACHTGDQMGACGNTGVECLQCGTQATGHMCVPTSNGGFCGCSSNNDCPGGGTCNTTTHLCI